MPTPTANTESLDSLIEDMKEGELQLPEFQRAFQWKSADQEALIESLLLLHPIGSMMLLELNHTDPLFAWTKLHNSTIPEMKNYETWEAQSDAGGKIKSSPPKRLILDGQQRMTTILQVFCGMADKVWYFDCKSILERWNEDSSPSTDIDLLEWTDSGKFVIKDYLKIGKKPTKKHAKHELFTKRFRFPLQMLISQSEYLAYIQEFKEWISDQIKDRTQRIDGHKKMKKDQTKASLKKEIVELNKKSDITFVLNYLMSNLGKQVVPITTLSNKFSITSVCKIFTVTNQSGLKLGAFDLVVASVYSDKVRLRRDFEEYLESNPLTKLIDDEDRTWVLQSLALVNGLSPNTNGLPKVIKSNHITTGLKSVIESFEKMCTILSEELHVPISEKGKSSITFDRILPSICAVQHQKQIDVIDIKVKADRVRKIKSWYYSAAVTKRYSTHSESRQVSDKIDVIDWFDKDFDADMPLWIKNVENLVNIHGTGSGSEASLILTLLNSGNPSDILTGKLCSYKSKNQVDVHHIFPKAAMREKIMKERKIKSKKDADKILREEEFFINSMLNKMLTDHNTNRDYIKVKMPSEYIDELIADGISEDELKKRFLNSFIDEDCYNALKKDDYHEFIKLRKKLIEKQINDAIGHDLYKL